MSTQSLLLASVNTFKDTLLEAGKVPSQPKKANKDSVAAAAVEAANSTVDLSLILRKAGRRVDLSSPVFQDLKTDDFVKHLCKATRELRVSGWAELSQLSFEHPLAKLRRVELSHCGLTSVNLDGLVSIESLVLSHNRLTEVPRLTACRKKLAYVDLSHNLVKNGFHFFTVCTKLRVLDLDSNDIGMTSNEFNRVVVSPLKSCRKLEYFSVDDNTQLTANCPDLNSFLVHEFPMLAFLNWRPVSKNNKRMAELKESRGKFETFHLPADKTSADEANVKNASLRPRISRAKSVSSTRRVATMGKAEGVSRSSTRLRSMSIPAPKPASEIEPVLVASPEPASWATDRKERPRRSRSKRDDLVTAVPSTPESNESAVFSRPPSISDSSDAYAASTEDQRPQLPPSRSLSPSPGKRRWTVLKKPLSSDDESTAPSKGKAEVPSSPSPDMSKVRRNSEGSERIFNGSDTINDFELPSGVSLATIRGQQGYVYRVPQTDISKKNKATGWFKLGSTPKFPAWNTQAWEESTWREMPKLVRVTKKQLRCHEKVLREIFTSEYRFANQLESLVAVEKHLLDIAKGATKKSKPVLSTDEIRSVFGDVSPILAFSSNLIESLKEVSDDIAPLGPRDPNFEGAFKSINAVKGFVRVFTESLGFFRVFQGFYGSYHASFQLLENCARDREQLREYLALVHTFNADSHGLSVPDLLVTPVQRVPRIKMLLLQLSEELGAYAKQFVEDRRSEPICADASTAAPSDRVDEIIAAICDAQLLVMQLHDRLSEVLSSMNAEMNASSLRKRWEELLSASMFAPNLKQFVSPQRRLLWDGIGSLGDFPHGHAFLFSDVLVMLKRDASPKQKKEVRWSLDRVLDVEELWMLDDKCFDSSVAGVTLETTFALKGVGIRQALTLAQRNLGAAKISQTRRRAASLGV